MSDVQAERQRKRQAKLRAEVQAFLDPGEQVQALFVSQTGPSPRGVLSVGLTSNLMRYWVVVVTDRNVVLCPLGMKKGARRLPRAPFEILEPPGRRSWFPIALGGERHWSAREEYDGVAAANEVLRTGSSATVAAPADWYPDPVHAHQLRYWDGQAWTANVADQGTPGVDPIPTS